MKKRFKAWLTSIVGVDPFYEKRCFELAEKLVLLQDKCSRLELELERYKKGEIKP